MPTCALITGASRGIGAAFARALPAATGLVLVARHADSLTRLETELARPGRTVTSVAADLTTESGRQAVVAAAEAHGVDLLINNAGIGRFGRVLDNSLADETAIAELNVVAPAMLTRALLPGMIARATRNRHRCGVILVSSTLAFQPLPYLATYAASKSFLLAYGEALAQELRDEPVDVLVLCPGATRTGFGARAGFEIGSLPGAADPQTVAREGLNALGRRTVHVVGLGTRTLLTPFLVPRRLATGGLGWLMEVVGAANRTRRAP